LKVVMIAGLLAPFTHICFNNEHSYSHHSPLTLFAAMCFIICGTLFEC